MPRQLLALAMLGVLLLLAAGCGGNGSNLPADLEEPGFTLPGLGELPVPDPSARRRVSDVNYELLLVAPLLTSGGGSVEHESGHVTLKPAENGGLAWAIFALPGFPTDETVYPTGITVDKNLPPVWVGLSNYARGAWEYTRFANSGGLPIENGTGLYSPGGVVYVALIATQGQPEVNTLTVTTNADLPGAPIAVINVPAKVVVDYPAAFTATGSDPGDGDWVSLTYTFDGADEQVVTDPDEEVTHTFTTEGLHSVELTVENTLARVDYTEADVNVQGLFRELLVVYNGDLQDDVDLADYYCSPATGRGIDPAYRLALLLSASPSEEISRPDYELQIRDPIITFLKANPDIENNIKYILLLKGVPMKINSNGNASVDSELCTLYSDAEEMYDYAGWVWNGQNYETFDTSGFYWAEDENFIPGGYTVSYNAETFPLDYLVGRISAYTYDNCRAMIDRALAADTSGAGWIIFDSSDGLYGGTPFHNMDTMVDPVYPLGSTAPDGEELLAPAGFNVYEDDTTDRIIATYPGLPPGFVNSILGYTSWGKHSGHPATYILDTLEWNYVNGACFMSYESFNGRTFRCTNPSDPAEGHPGQGLIADFFYMGGTCAVGNVYEPYTLGVGDERWVFDRYIHHGDRWIEAAYKGLRLFSWMEVVVGDPLCQVMAE